MADTDRLVGENRCWPCTVANAVVAAFVAGVPLLAALLRGDPAILSITVAWALAVAGYALYRLLSRGYLPGSEAVTRRTGLHERIGPGTADAGEDADRGRDGPPERRRNPERESDDRSSGS